MGARSTNPTQSFFDDFSVVELMSDAPPLPSPITTGGQSALDISGYKVHLFTNTVLKLLTFNLVMVKLNT